ncbi:hypothetical protein KC332_g5028 [Hortaea werneckii]|nr:hypothetical protein KC350_g3997 [Hortaea werneckii]KAI6847608.1 hypothetical protein KC358_g2228 [Hortaea werneckii]KAI6942449.1 hypothetical protein KC341_g2226 [Hortaea werneckii]KAI6948142.1 hypothetical protein KC348_g2101 [Hortaea werneckii]KAI6980095.1 hypothetical protein KC321_g1960 [Hortaea werneckii]
MVRSSEASVPSNLGDATIQGIDRSILSPENTIRTSNENTPSAARRTFGPQSDGSQNKTSKGCARKEDCQLETPEGDDDYHSQDGDEADEDYSPSLVDTEDEHAFFQDGDEHDEDYIPNSKETIPTAPGSKSRRKETSKPTKATAPWTKKPAQDLKQQGGLKVLLDWPTPVLTRLQALSEVTPGRFPKAQKYFLDAYGTVKSNIDESPLKTNFLIAVLDAAKRIALNDPGLDSKGSGIEEQRLVQKDRVAAGNESHADTANDIVDKHRQHTHNFSMYSGSSSLANNKTAGVVSADKVTHESASSKPNSQGLLIDSKTDSYSAPVRSQGANREDKAMNPSRTAYRMDDKPFCTYWVMNGYCDYLHTTHGCRYPHFLPNRELCKAILPRIEYPPFWISQNAELYKRFLDGELLHWTLADFESRRHRRAGAMRVQHSNEKQRLVPAATSVRPAPVSGYTSQAQRSSTMATATEQIRHAPKLIPNTPDTSHRRIASPHGHEQRYSRIGERPMPEETLRPQALPGRSIAQGMNDPTVNATNKRRLQAIEDVPTKRRETSTDRDGLPSQPKTNASPLSRVSGVRGGSTGR